MRFRRFGCLLLIATGYLHPDYAGSLKEFGRPVALPKSGGWLLERPIADSDLKDAMGCYPLFCCSNWSGLKSDLDDLRDKYVTVSLTTDPFADVEPDEWADSFGFVRPFKDHFVVDLSVPTEQHVSRHHRYYARKSLQYLKVEIVCDAGALLSEWMYLYDTLIERHGLTGIKAFSRQAFAAQLSVPGLIMFAGTIDGKLVGAQLWYAQGTVAYSHLTAISEKGYSARAAYGLYGAAIDFFKQQSDARLHWLDLGAGPGLSGKDGGGLRAFKKGWSTGTRTNYFCGRINQPGTYALLVKQMASSRVDYFPPYRGASLS